MYPQFSTGPIHQCSHKWESGKLIVGEGTLVAPRTDTARQGWILLVLREIAAFSGFFTADTACISSISLFDTVGEMPVLAEYWPSVLLLLPVPAVFRPSIPQ